MELSVDKLMQALPRMEKEGFPPVILIYGDDVFTARAYQALVDALVPENLRSLNLEVFGAEAGAGSVAEALFTFPMFPADKVVAWKDTRALSSSKQARPILEKALAAFAADEKKKAAGYLISAMELSGLSFEDADPRDPAACFGADMPEQAEGFEALFSYCRDLEKKPASSQGDTEILLGALRQGFPPGNRLILTSPAVDKRMAAYALIRDQGLVVDASLPEGTRMADVKVREQAAGQLVRSVLGPLGKTIAPDALNELMARAGTDMRSLAAHAEKLALAAEERKQISAADVKSAVSRTRSDPMYLFTDAVAERNAQTALSLLFRLLDDGAQPIYLVAALAGKLRSLIAARSFLAGPEGRIFSPSMSFPAFRDKVLPALAAFEAREEEPEPDQGAPEKKGGKGKKKKKAAAGSDLMLTGKSRPPYVAYIALKRAAGFSAAELADALLSLYELDRTLKSSPADPKTLLSNLAVSLCRGAGRAL